MGKWDLEVGVEPSTRFKCHEPELKLKQDIFKESEFKLKQDIFNEPVLKLKQENYLESELKLKQENFKNQNWNWNKLFSAIKNLRNFQSKTSISEVFTQNI